MVVVVVVHTSAEWVRAVSACCRRLSGGCLRGRRDRNDSVMNGHGMRLLLAGMEGGEQRCGGGGRCLRALSG